MPTAAKPPDTASHQKGGLAWRRDRRRARATVGPVWLRRLPVLSAIAKTGDVALGGLALFRWRWAWRAAHHRRRAHPQRPAQNGPWMENVKRAFGVMLLAVAVWLVSSPVLPGVVTMLAWARRSWSSGDLPPRPRPLPPHASAGSASGGLA